MLKFLGALLLAGGTAALGLNAAHRLSVRLQVLSSLLTALQLMQAEIAFRQTPVPELLEQLTHQLPPPADGLFALCAQRGEELGRVPFSEIWRESVESCRGLELSRQERRELAAIGNILGRYDVDGQLAALAALERRVEQLFSQAQQERDSRSKVFSALGIVTGLALIILLL